MDIMDNLPASRELLAKKHKLIVSSRFPDLLLHDCLSPKPYVRLK